MITIWHLFRNRVCMETPSQLPNSDVEFQIRFFLLFFSRVLSTHLIDQKNKCFIFVFASNYSTVIELIELVLFLDILVKFVLPKGFCDFNKRLKFD